MSLMGQTLRSNSAFGPKFVRSYPKSDQKWCTATSRVICHSEPTHRSKLCPYSTASSAWASGVGGTVFG